MKKVLVLNNYPLEDVWEEVKRKDKPDHHLYGINYFNQRKFEIEIIPFKSSQLLQKLNNFYQKSKLIVPIGDTDQQWSCLQRLNQADLIYAPCQTQTHLLSYLRAMGIIKIPIVCVAHHHLNRGRLALVR